MTKCTITFASDERGRGRLGTEEFTRYDENEYDRSGEWMRVICTEEAQAEFLSAVCAHAWALATAHGVPAAYGRVEWHEHDAGLGEWELFFQREEDGADGR